MTWQATPTFRASVALLVFVLLAPFDRPSMAAAAPPVTQPPPDDVIDVGAGVREAIRKQNKKLAAEVLKEIDL